MEASRLIILLNATCWFVFVSKPPANVGVAQAIAMATQTNFSFFILIILNKNVRKGKRMFYLDTERYAYLKHINRKRRLCCTDFKICAEFYFCSG